MIEKCDRLMRLRNNKKDFQAGSLFYLNNNTNYLSFAALARVVNKATAAKTTMIIPKIINCVLPLITGLSPTHKQPKTKAAMPETMDKQAGKTRPLPLIALKRTKTPSKIMTAPTVIKT